MDGALRRITPHTWQGTLNGYRVQVFNTGGSWHYAVIHPRGWTCVCPPAASFADAAAKARAWVEANPPPQS